MWYGVSELEPDVGGGLGWFFTRFGGPLYSWNLITRFGGVLAGFFFTLANRLLLPLLLPCDEVLELLENSGGDIALVKRTESSVAALIEERLDAEAKLEADVPAEICDRVKVCDGERTPLCWRDCMKGTMSGGGGIVTGDIAASLKISLWPGDDASSLPQTSSGSSLN